jgi:hypothetical protein
MAVQLNNGSTDEYLYLPNDATPLSTGATTSWSMGLWFYRDTDTATNEHIAMLTNDTIGVASSGQGLRVSSADILQVTAGGGQTTLLNPLPLASWYYAGITFGNGSGTAYYGTTPGTLIAGTGRSNVSGSLDTIILGRSPAAAGGGQPFKGRLGHVRFWSGVLSQAEFEAEMASMTAVKTSGLYAAYEFTSQASTVAMLADTSGNARTLTQNGGIILASNYIAGPTLTSGPTAAQKAACVRRYLHD